MRPIWKLVAVTVPLLALVAKPLSAQEPIRSLTAGKADPARHDLRALPTPEQLGQFDRYNRFVSRDYASAFASRASDGLRITVDISTFADDRAAKKYFGESFNPNWLRTSTSATGRNIGQEALFTRNEPGKPLLGTYTVRARDGRAVVSVDVSVPSVGDADIPLTTVQLRLAEDQAIGALDRLTRLGDTSRSVVKPAKTAKSADKPDRKADKP